MNWLTVIFLWVALFVAGCSNEESAPGAGSGTVPVIPPAHPAPVSASGNAVDLPGSNVKNYTGSGQLKTTSAAVAARDTASRAMPARDLIARLERSRADLREPFNIRRLTADPEGFLSQPMIRISQEKFLGINFDNDIFDYTDRFYTNGIRIDLIAPGLRHNPVNMLLLPYWKAGVNFYGLSLVQNMYTPSTTKTGGIPRGDRPYAAYLLLESFKITSDAAGRYRQRSSVSAGIIGSHSFGGWVQSKFHTTVPSNHEPLGWEYQIENDLVLNYSAAIEKGLLATGFSDINVTAEGNLGTLYTNLSGGVRLRVGKISPYFNGPGISRAGSTGHPQIPKFQAYLFGRGSLQLVGYDATLQGGLFNRSSHYTIAAGDVSRLVANFSGGFTFSAGGVGVDVEQFFLSPEFKGGLWHRWVHIGLRFAL